MTESYDPYANAIAERVNGILKQEFMLEELNLPMMDMKRVIKVLFINITILDHIIRVGTKYPSICRGRIIKRNNSVRLTLLSCAKCFIFVQ
jgi:integrase, catalytic region